MSPDGLCGAENIDEIIVVVVWQAAGRKVSWGQVQRILFYDFQRQVFNKKVRKKFQDDGVIDVPGTGYATCMICRLTSGGYGYASIAKPYI